MRRLDAEGTFRIGEHHPVLDLAEHPRAEADEPVRLGRDVRGAHETHQHALLVRIHAFIQQHLGDPELSPSSIAAAHHITPRYLHMLFRNEGATVATWIRQRRLERTRHEPSDPPSVARPVARIAARWGFSGASHFSSVFKAAYGMPPQEYRQHVLAGCCGTLRGS